MTNTALSSASILTVEGIVIAGVFDMQLVRIDAEDRAVFVM
jgi:hypothetical protein